jgi:hypothetical protein
METMTMTVIEIQPDTIELPEEEEPEPYDPDEDEYPDVQEPTKPEWGI